MMIQLPKSHIHRALRLHSSTSPKSSESSISCLRQQRSFTSTPIHQSKLARKPISVPETVSLTLIHPKPPTKPPPNPWQDPEPRTLRIEGPKGIISMSVPPYLSINRPKPPHGPIQLSIPDATVKSHRAMWGTLRALISNHITGVSAGHTALLRFVGVGYRASIESTAVTKQPEYEGQKFVSLKVGYSHPIELGVPKDVVASAPMPTRLLLEGPDKREVMQFAAEIRRWRKPEPYKGKGIFVNDETITLKAKKIK